jgi:hypothetical protein
MGACKRKKEREKEEKKLLASWSFYIRANARASERFFYLLGSFFHPAKACRGMGFPIWCKLCRCAPFGVPPDERERMRESGKLMTGLVETLVARGIIKQILPRIKFHCKNSVMRCKNCAVALLIMLM